MVKNATKKIFSFLLTLMISLSAWSREYVEIGMTAYFLYEDYTAEWVDMDYVRWYDEMIIPSSVSYNGKDYTVTMIGDNGFNDSPKLKGVTIPSTVDSIGIDAFTQCPELINLYVSWTGAQLNKLKVNANAFDNDRLNQITLHLPAEYLDTYKKTSPWKRFNLQPVSSDYTISYDLDGGKLEDGVSNPDVYNAQTPTFVLNNPVRAGYAFRGWNTAKNTYEVVFTGSTGNRTYKALWEKLPEVASQTAYSLTGIPDGWTVKAGGKDIAVNEGKTADIAPGARVQICPPTDAHVKHIKVSTTTFDLVSFTQPATIICADGDTITGTVTGDIMIVIPDGVSVVFYNVNLTDTAAHPAVFCQGNATIISDGKLGNTITCTQDNQPGIQAFGKGTTLTFMGASNLTIKAGNEVDNIDLNGAKAVNLMTGALVGNTPVIYKPVARSLTYDGTPQQLIDTTFTNTDIMYSLDQRKWSDTIPSVTNAGTYTVYYKPDTMSIYNAEVQSVKVTIAKKEATISYANLVMYVDPDSVFTNPLTNTGDGKVTYSTTSSSISVDTNGKVTCVCAGNKAIITATVANSTNCTYAVSSVQYAVEIYEMTPRSWNYSFTGNVQTFTARATGTYKLEVWGAQGGTCSFDTIIKDRGKGGYATCLISLNCGDQLYIYVGGQGKSPKSSTDSIGAYGGWNGGGKGGNAVKNHEGGAGGGGATHISKVNNQVIGSGTGQTTTLANTNYIIVAGGGGGESHENCIAGEGGGEDGMRGRNAEGKFYSDHAYHNTSYSYGKSAGKATNKKDCDYAREGSGGGGGGFYGGDAQNDHTKKYDDAGGCGGSSNYNDKLGFNFSTTPGEKTGNGKAKISFVE